jgi:hypothetical protein
MKHLKYFENTIEDKSIQPQIGDYVLMKQFQTQNYQSDFCEFIATNIGQIISMDEDTPILFIVRYNTNVPEIGGLTPDRITAKLEEFLIFSPNKKDIIPYLDITKFNI